MHPTERREDPGGDRRRAILVQRAAQAALPVSR